MMSAMKKCSTEAFIAIDNTVLSNAKIPRPQSLLSMPEFLASESTMESGQNSSQSSTALSRRPLRIEEQQQHTPVIRWTDSAEDEDCKISNVRQERRSRRRTAQASSMARNRDSPYNGRRQSIEKAAHSKSAALKEIVRSNDRSQKPRRMPMIMRTNKISTLARREKIPKWIIITAPSPLSEEPALSSKNRSQKQRQKEMIVRTNEISTLGRRETVPKWINTKIKVDLPDPTSPGGADISSHRDFISLKELAMILSNNLEGTIAKGTFDTESRAKKTKPEADTLSTAIISSYNLEDAIARGTFDTESRTEKKKTGGDSLSTATSATSLSSLHTPSLGDTSADAMLVAVPQVLLVV